MELRGFLQVCSFQASDIPLDTLSSIPRKVGIRQRLGTVRALKFFYVETHITLKGKLHYATH